MASLFSKFANLFRRREEAAEEMEEPPARDNAAVYGTESVALSREFFQKLAPEAQVEAGPVDGDERSFILRWAGTTVVANHRPFSDRDRQVPGMIGFISKVTPPDADHQAVEALLERINRAVFCCGCVITPGYDAQGQVARFVSNFATAIEGFVFSHQSFYDETGLRVTGLPNDPGHLGPPAPSDQEERRRRIQEHKARPPSEAAQARKLRSMARLRAEGVPVIDHLPVIADENQATVRSQEEVVKRAIALAIVAVKGEGMEQERVLEIIEEYRAESYLSPDEMLFINDPEPEEQDRIQFCWRYECLWVLHWALGYLEELPRPDEICDVPRSVDLIVSRGADGFLADARLRPISEILDEADLAYRYHWATKNARVRNEEMPAGLEGGVVQERHYAFNWLIGYMNQEWDDISADT